MRIRWWLAAGAMVLAGCARSQAEVMPPPTPVPVDETLFRGPRTDPLLAVPGDSLRVRWSVRPVPPSRGYTRALAAGTRSATGAPGASYWQQRVRYRIDAELDPKTSRLTGASRVHYHNRSPDTLGVLQVMLYQNAFAEGAERVRQVPVTGGVTLERVTLDGTSLSGGARLGAGYRVDGTLLYITPAQPLLPGDSAVLEFDWHFTVPPRGAPRTGHADGEAYVVAQWYPQVAMYDDVRGWHDLPYWTNGEFHQPYADYEVALTVPEGWSVSATGVLQNADEVLNERTRARLARALAQDSVVRVVTADDLETGGATVREPGGQLTWRFSAGDVRDFAFAASPRYLWDATRALLPDADGDGREEVVAVHALYRPEAERWHEAARYMRHSLSYHARAWGPYIYPHVSAAEGPIGGMEYPMLLFIGSPRSPEALYGVLSHELAHQWFPMMVGSNETLYAWQDEGTASYMEDLSAADYFSGSRPALVTQDAYLAIAGRDAERPIMTPPDLFGAGPQYGIAAYSKPASLLRALSRVLGDSVFERGLRTYAERWLLKHPTPWDFFQTFEEVSGRELDWFWSPWYFDTAWLDQAVADVSVVEGGAVAPAERVRITIEDLGTAPMPVELAVTLATGEVLRTTLPVQPWLAGRTTQTVDIDAPARVVRVEIDPERWFPDVARANNAWVRQP